MEQKSSGALEFVPAMVYPERSRVLIMDADGIQVQEGPKELPWTENAADVLPNYPFISGRRIVSIRPSKYFAILNGGVSVIIARGETTTSLDRCSSDIPLTHASLH